MTEIQIEGPNGWATSLPTWRIEHHPLLDIFWGGRAMTGYHAWFFSFILLVFHLPHVIYGKLFAAHGGTLPWFSDAVLDHRGFPLVCTQPGLRTQPLFSRAPYSGINIGFQECLLTI